MTNQQKPRKRKTVQHEAMEQEKIFNWTCFAMGEYPELALLYHIPNGGSRNRLEAYNLKKQGVKAGVPDLCLPVARGKWHGLYIELKHGKNTTSQNQDNWIAALEQQGYCAVVCHGYNEAVDTLQKYLGSGKGK